MPKLKTIYDAQEEIPEGFGELYAEKGGKFELVGIEGVKTQADVDRVQTALVKERNERKADKEKLTAFTTALGDIDPATIPETIEERDSLKAQVESLTKEGKLDEPKITERINAAVNQAVGPVKRDLDATKRQLDAEQKKTAEEKTANAALQLQMKQERIRQQLRDAAIEAKVLPTAIDDAVLVGERMFDYTDDGKLVTKADLGVAPGLNPKDWAKDMKELRPHWWPVSQGGGARGGTGVNATGKDNPWSPEGWNITAQGRVVKELGVAKAAEMAAKVGAKIGQAHPTPKAA